MRQPRVGLLATHPIQYYSPWYRELAKHVELKVYYCDRQSSAGQAAAGFGVEFEWDIPLLDGHDHHFLHNRARRPDVSRFWGCDTPEIGAIIRRERFDAFIVLGWYVRSFWQAMVACWRTGTPLLVRGDSHLQTTRSLPKRLAKEAFYRLFIPRFDGYLVVGKANRDYLLHYGADPARMVEVPHAIDNDFFARRTDALRPERAAIRAAWGIPSDAFVFLFAAKFIAKKQPNDFASALALAVEKNAHIYGLMAGDGPLRGEIERRIKVEGLPVRLVGFLNQSELPNAFVASDTLVVPSDSRETWGLIVNEAMASGLPAIVSNAVGSARDLILPGQTGDSYPMGDISALATLLQRYAEAPAAQHQHWRDTVRAHIANYSVESAAIQTAEAVRRVLSKKHGSPLPSAPSPDDRAGGER